MHKIIMVWLLAFSAAQFIRKWDWENNYYALQCTCPKGCCLDGSFQLTNDTVLSGNYVKLSGKIAGSMCAQQY